MINLLICAQDAWCWGLERIICCGQEEVHPRRCFYWACDAQTVGIYLVPNLARETQNCKWLVEARWLFEALKFLTDLIVSASCWANESQRCLRPAWIVKAVVDTVQEPLEINHRVSWMLRKYDGDEADLAWICTTLDNSARVLTYLVELSEQSRGVDRGLWPTNLMSDWDAGYHPLIGCRRSWVISLLW